MAKRKNGYYWVKMYDEWEVGYWDGDSWQLMNIICYYYDSDFKSINEAQIMRNES